MFQLSGGDGGAYGPLFGPVNAVEYGEIEVTDNRKHLVLKLEEPIREGEMQKQKGLTESLKHFGREKTAFHISHQSRADFVMGGLRMSLIQLS